MKKRIVVAIRDMGPANVLLPMVQELRGLGHEVHLLIEKDGRATAKLNESLQPYQLVDEGDSPRDILVKLNPDALVTGISSPRVMEAEFDRQARSFSHHVPLVHAVDYWGVEKRAEQPADLYLTIDAVSDTLVRQRWPGRQVSIVQVGFAGITPVKANPDLKARMDSLREKASDKLLVYPDGGPDADPALRHLVSSILETSQRVILIPKFHPKFKDVLREDGTTWGVWCDRVLEPLTMCGRVHMMSEPTDEIIQYADGVASGYSSTLMRPATAGKLALTLWNQSTASELFRQAGLKKSPLMMQGGYPVLAQPKPLDEFFKRQWPKYELQPLNPSIGAQAILALLD